MIRRKKKTDKTKLIEKKIELDVEQTPTSSQEVESTVNNSFFYTNDRFFELMDSNVVLNSIISEYPNLNQKNTDLELKHEMLNFIQDKMFIDILLEQYNITFIELFKIICKSYSMIFKGAYLKKIKNIIETYDY